MQQQTLLQQNMGQKLNLTVSQYVQMLELDQQRMLENIKEKREENKELEKSLSDLKKEMVELVKTRCTKAEMEKVMKLEKQVAENTKKINENVKQINENTVKIAEFTENKKSDEICNFIVILLLIFLIGYDMIDAARVVLVLWLIEKLIVIIGLYSRRSSKKLQAIPEYKSKIGGC